MRKGLLWIILVMFAGYSTWALVNVGYLGIWQAGFDNPGSLQILMDLAIACILVCSWIQGDAKSRGISPYPWWVATALTGSIALLVYFLVREYRKTTNSPIAQQAG